MKFIGQYIQSLIARFRNDVYLEDISTGTIASGGNLGLDSNNKIVKADEATGDITQVRITADDSNVASDDSGSADFTIAGGEGIDTSVSSTTITIAGELASTSNKGVASFNSDNFAVADGVVTIKDEGVDLAAEVTGRLPVANGGTGAATLTDGGILLGSGTGAVTATAVLGDGEILIGDGTTDPVALDVGSSTAITTLGTISTGVWNGTAIATDQQKHLAYFEFKGYGTGDGTNYEMPEQITDANAPFEHNTSTGSDGLTAQTIQTVMRSGGVVMPYTGVLKKFQGWATSAGSGTLNIALFKFTPTDDTAGNLTPAQLVNESITASGNAIMNSFSETSSFDAGFTAGDIIYPAVLGIDTKVFYFNSILVVEWS